jgi:hypothetical protein
MDFKQLTIPQKIVFGNNVVSQMTTNAGTFATPAVGVTVLQKITGQLQSNAADAAGGDHQKVAVMHSTEKNWDNLFGQQAVYVDSIAQGDVSIILLSGFKATKNESTPSGEPEVVKIIKLVPNAKAGSIYLEIDSMVRGTVFMYFVCSDAAKIVMVNNELSIAGNPTLLAFITDTHRKVNFNNLPSRATVYVSVAAFNSAGFGEVSAPVAVDTL